MWMALVIFCYVGLRCYMVLLFFFVAWKILFRVPVLVPVRASPVPSVVRGSFVVKFFFALTLVAGSLLCRACLL